MDFRFRVQVELPDGKSAEFETSVPIVNWETYVDDSLGHLAAVAGEARQWIESQRREFQP